MKKLVLFGCALVLLAALIVTGCGGSTPSPTPTQTPVSGQASVNIQNLAFTPETLQITAGTTVTWTNNDSTAHTVSSKNGVFESGNMATGATFSYTFNQIGSFDYYCKIHPFMTARVIVE
jgi:plastocyanin